MLTAISIGPEATTDLLSPSSGVPDASRTANLIDGLLAGSESATWGAANLRVLRNLSEESDPQLFYSDLLSWAREQESGDRPQLSQRTYQYLGANGEVPSWVQERARHRLAVLAGEGNFFENTEQFFSETFRQVLTPANLLAMTGAGLAFRFSRLGFLRFLGNAGLRGAPLHLGAAGAAFNVEALSFPLLNRLGHWGFGGRADWSRESLSRDIYSSYLFLGGMRAANFAAGKFLQWGSAVPGADRLWAPNLGSLGLSGSLARSGAMFAGVLGAGMAEQWGGLREFSSAGDFLQHSLRTFLQFKLAGAALSYGLGPRFAAFERRLDLEALRLREPTATPRAPFPDSFQTAFAGAALAAGGLEAGAPLPPFWMAMSQARPIGLRPLPGTGPAVELPGGMPAEPTVLPPPVSELPPATRSRSGIIPTNGTPHVPRFELADALVRHRGSVDGAAKELGLSTEVLTRRLEQESFFSELSVFPVGGHGRMLFYRPAVARARSQLGTHVYTPESLAALELSPATNEFVQRMGVQSLWDLLMVTRADMNRARRLGESPPLLEATIQEMEAKINGNLLNPLGKVLENHPFGEGSVKILMGRYLGEVPVADLGLPPDIFNHLTRGGIKSVADLMDRPIPQWISREVIPEGSAPGTREAMIDEVIRPLYALLHGAGPRRYRAPDLAETGARFLAPASPLGRDPAPRLAGVGEVELIRRLVTSGGNLSEVADFFGQSSRVLAEFIQKHDYNSELSVYQGMGKGSMLFYTPALRQAVTEFGTQVHYPESLTGLELSPQRQAQLESMGVTSLRDLLLLTRFDLEGQLGNREADRFMSELDPVINAQLNRSGLRRIHYPFRPGTIKEAMLERYEDASLYQLRLPETTRKLLQENGIHSIGDLMRRPIPDWIRPEQMPEGSHPATRAHVLDQVIRSCYAMLRSGYHFPLEPR